MALYAIAISSEDDEMTIYMYRDAFQASMVYSILSHGESYSDYGYYADRILKYHGIQPTKEDIEAIMDEPGVSLRIIS